MLETKNLSEIILHDESTFRHVALYGRLKTAMLDRGMCFHVLGDAEKIGGADAARLLNLAFWDPSAHAEILDEPELEADQLMHNAWHVLAREACGDDHQSADALLLAEAIASAFDVYLIGRTLGHAPDSSFLETQVAAMSYSANAAGVNEQQFGDLLERLSASPEATFEELRQLLFDAASELVAAQSLDAATAVLLNHADHPMFPLLHHYELPTWVLYARCYGSTCEPVANVRAMDHAMRKSNDSVLWLEENWLD